jgi:hypothetical protein
MSFSCEERRLGWLSELLECASEEATKDRTSGVRTFLVQFRTARHSLRICHPRKRASCERSPAKFKRGADRAKYPMAAASQLAIGTGSESQFQPGRP